ncbi:MAG: BPL-N domain-containing protein [Candidatus Odinarchaeia archaeon]
MKKCRKNMILAFAISLAIIVPGIAVFNPFVNAQGNPTYIIPLDDWVLNDDLQAFRLVNILLEENVTVKWAQESFTANGITYPAGTIFIETPFTTKRGLSSDVVMEWLMWEAKNTGVRRIDVTLDVITALSVPLVAPRVLIFYDKSTYDNCLNHYYRLKSVGIKAKLATANEMTGMWWNDTTHPLYDSNVFLMPGGALHLWSFPNWWTPGSPGALAISNISDWVFNGGGYIGTCTGSSEALNKTPYLNLGIVDADYHREWFDISLAPPGMGANEWKALIGPIQITIEEPNHPVMFGYGVNAVRPCYGPEVPLYYYGGPAFVNITATNTTILGNYSTPVAQNIDAAGLTNTIWGEPAIIAANHGSGRVVLFGPHPEWPGPGARMEAQAIFWTAQKIIPDSHIDPQTTSYNPAEIYFNRVNIILDTAAEIEPKLEELTRLATEIVQFRAGDHYNPIGYWFDEVLMVYGLEMTEHLNELKRDAVKLQYEYYKLTLLRGSVSPTTRNMIDYALALIDSFFNYSETFPYEDHWIADNDIWYTGLIWAPYIGDAANFTELPNLFDYVLNETKELVYPMCYNYTRDYFNVYNELFALNQTFPSSIPDNATLERWGFNLTLYAGSNVTDLLVGLYNTLTSGWPAGPMIIMYYMFYHVLDICQFKIDGHWLKMMSIAERAREVCGMVSYQIAAEIGGWAYSTAEWQATIYQPAGAFA